MITQERADKLSKILTSDQERAKVLLSLDSNEALAQINALGNDFTLDEIKEYGKALRATIAMQNGELSSDDLDEVAGGVGALAIMGLVFLGGVILGAASTIKW